MSRTYEDYPRTAFPEDVDEFRVLRDADSEVLTDIKTYQNYIQNGRTEEAQELIEQDNGKLKNYLFRAEDYNKLTNAIMAIETYFIEKFNAVIESLVNKVGGRIGVLGKKDTSEQAYTINSTSAYSIIASEEIFQKKAEYAQYTLLSNSWNRNSATLWSYSFEHEDSQGNGYYPSTIYDIEISLSSDASLEQAKAWGKLMASGDTENNIIYTRVGAPTVDIPVIIKIYKIYE